MYQENEQKSTVFICINNNQFEDKSKNDKL